MKSLHDAYCAPSLAETAVDEQPPTAAEAAVAAAVTAWREGPVSPPVESALRNLEALYEGKADPGDIETGEKYVMEAWLEYRHPAGVVYKG